MGAMNESVEVNQPLARDMESEVYVKQTVRKSNSAQKAVTHFEPLHYCPEANLSLVRVTPITGANTRSVRMRNGWGCRCLGIRSTVPMRGTTWSLSKKDGPKGCSRRCSFPGRHYMRPRLSLKESRYKRFFHAPLTPDLIVLNEKIGATVD